MIKRSDFWVAFLIGLHVVLLQPVVEIGKSFLAGQTIRSMSFNHPVVLIKIILSCLVFALFFNSLYRTLVLFIVSEEKLQQQLFTSLLTVASLVSLLLFVSVFPSF